MTLEAPAVGSTVGPWLILERWGSGSFGIICKDQGFWTGPEHHQYPYVVMEGEEGDRYSSEPSASEERSDTEPARSHSDTPERGQRMRQAYLLYLTALS